MNAQNTGFMKLNRRSQVDVIFDLYDYVKLAHVISRCTNEKYITDEYQNSVVPEPFYRSNPTQGKSPDINQVAHILFSLILYTYILYKRSATIMYT